MSPLLAPVLAQVITLGVGDSTEVRYLHWEDTRYEAATTPGIRLSLRWRRDDLAIAYSPSFTLSPLEREPRELSIFHNATINAAHRWRKTTLSLSMGFGYGEVNYALLVLRDPGFTPGAGAEPAPPVSPGEGGQVPGGEPPTQVKIANQEVNIGSWGTTLSLAHRPTKEVQLGAYTGYSMSGGLDSESSEFYPFTRGVFVGANATHAHAVSADDNFSTGASFQQGWSSEGNVFSNLWLNETWTHDFSPRTSSQLGGGVSFSRQSQSNGLVAVSSYPTFLAGLSHNNRVAGGSLVMNISAYSAPALDPLRATIDPRVGFGASIGWARDKFSSSLSGDAQVSVAQPDASIAAVNAAAAAFSVNYALGDVVSLNGGVRAAVQSFDDLQVIPPSWTAYLGVSFGYERVLKGKQ